MGTRTPPTNSTPSPISLPKEIRKKTQTSHRRRKRQIVLEIRKQHPLAAVTLEKILAEQGIHIGHNRIHRILKEEGLVKDEPHKQRRRTWIRYERRYSNSLWHADWFEEPHEQIILFEDDASRFITGYGVFSNANMENSNQVLQQAIASYGSPKQMMTDHGTQFTSLPKRNLPRSTTEHVSTTVETTWDPSYQSTGETPTIQWKSRTSWTNHRTTTKTLLQLG